MIEDLRRIEVRGYIDIAMDGRLWRRLLLEAKAHVGKASAEEEQEPL